MAEQVTNYQCPACTGPLRFDGKIGKLKCDYCGSVYTVEEVEELFAAKNDAAEEARREADARAEKEAAGTAPSGAGPATGAAGPSGAGDASWGKEAAKMRAYNCTSCGAELICDETTAATQCPYCGNNSIIPGTFAGTQRPDYVIPFQYEKKDAVKALKDYYKGKTLLPASFNNANHLEEIKGVYVPFWLYSGHVDAEGIFDARQDEVHRQGEFEVTRSRHYEARRKGTISFTRIPVDASSKMPDDLMDSIEPFDYRAITDFSLAYMPGYMANKYDVGQKECGRRAQDRARKSAEEALRGTVQGYTSVTTRAHEETIHQEKVDYAVFPVWLLSTRWEGQNFLFAMNGQTGRMVGNLPISKSRQAIWFGGVFLLCFLMFNIFLFGGEGRSMTSYLIALVMSLIPAAIVNAVLVGQMRPVAQKSVAFAYAEKGGIRLHEKDDRFLRATESRARVQGARAGGGGQAGGPRSHGPGGPGGHGSPGRHGAPGGKRP